ncbi:MAG TPA: YgaP-like transmembrane domain [Flavobacterium sp.]|jgi:uncharacterized membrane protein
MENFVYARNGRINVGTTERIISVLAGGFLLYEALKNRNMLAAAIPAALIMARGVSGYCPAYDIMGKKKLKKHNINIQTHLTINRPIAEVYEFWRKLENLPLFMEHLENVTEIDAGLSEWKAKIPGGLGTVTWNAIIVNEKENEVLGWKSVKGSAVDNAGKIEFIELDENVTGLHVVISYRAPMGAIGENIARLFTPSFKKMIQADIDGFRDYMENGFTATQTTDFRNQLI